MPNTLDFFFNSFLFLFSFFQKNEPNSMFRLFSFEIYKLDFKKSLSFFIKNKLYSLRLLNCHFLKKVLSLPLFWVRGKYLKILNRESFSAKHTKFRLSLGRVILNNELLNYRNSLITYYFYCCLRLFQVRAHRFLKKKKWLFFHKFVYCKLLLKHCGVLNS